MRGRDRTRRTCYAESASLLANRRQNYARRRLASGLRSRRRALTALRPAGRLLKRNGRHARLYPNLPLSRRNMSSTPFPVLGIDSAIQVLERSIQSPNAEVHTLASRLPTRHFEIVGNQPVCGIGEVIRNIQVN